MVRRWHSRVVGCRNTILKKGSQCHPLYWNGVTDLQRLLPSLWENSTLKGRLLFVSALLTHSPKLAHTELSLDGGIIMTAILNVLVVFQ